MRDITLNVRPYRNLLENSMFYDQYSVRDDETPEIIAERLYGSAELHWVLLLVNEKYHWLDDWPIPDYKLDDYIQAKYGAENINSIHDIYGRDHYVNLTGKIVDADYPSATAVSNADYERDVNSKKKLIKIVLPALIDVFVKDLEEAFEQ